jgi:hypothetical protein
MEMQNICWFLNNLQTFGWKVGKIEAFYFWNKGYQVLQLWILSIIVTPFQQFSIRFCLNLILTVFHAVLLEETKIWSTETQSHVHGFHNLFIY